MIFPGLDTTVKEERANCVKNSSLAQWKSSKDINSSDKRDSDDDDESFFLCSGGGAEKSSEITISLSHFGLSGGAVIFKLGCPLLKQYPG